MKYFCLEKQDNVSQTKQPQMLKTCLVTYRTFRLKQFISEETSPVILLFSSFLQERITEMWINNQLKITYWTFYQTSRTMLHGKIWLTTTSDFAAFQVLEESNHQDGYLTSHWNNTQVIQYSIHGTNCSKDSWSDHEVLTSPWYSSSSQTLQGCIQ